MNLGVKSVTLESIKLSTKQQMKRMKRKKRGGGEEEDSAEDEPEDAGCPLQPLHVISTEQIHYSSVCCV